MTSNIPKTLIDIWVTQPNTAWDFLLTLVLLQEQLYPLEVTIIIALKLTHSNHCFGHAKRISRHY